MSAIAIFVLAYAIVFVVTLTGVYLLGLATARRTWRTTMEAFDTHDNRTFTPNPPPESPVDPERWEA